MKRAICYRDHETFRAEKLPDSLYFDLTTDPMVLWFFCPCGCGAPNLITIGKDSKPAQSPSWSWNGSLSEPSLMPSVHQLLCGWHGWLRDGYWESV